MSADESTLLGARYAITAEYDGAAFSGWQRQSNAPSVQACLEDAWQRLTGETVRLVGGSRTDAGVSARRHVSAFTSRTTIPTERIALAWNTALPPTVAVHDARRVHGDFNPRYDALGKRYRYTIVRGPIRPVIDRHTAAHVPGELDINAMAEAADAFVGTHDFTALMDQGSPTRRPIRTLYAVELDDDDRTLTVRVTGDGFLYHMVRILVGTLVYVGQGKLAAGDISYILASGRRVSAGPTMPPEGLVLEHVYFAETLFGGDRWPYDDPRRASKRARLYPAPSKESSDDRTRME
ncbi:MAG: tRNA pseudouridine(38-40) synthase TruA [Saccharofermentanales bacterium]